MAFESLKEILHLCEEEQMPFWKAVLRDDMNERNVSEEESLEQMHRLWEAMQQAAASYDKNLKSQSSLVGGDGGKMQEYLENGDTLCGPFMGKVIATAQ